VKHADLNMHESSLLTQIRTGKVGLQGFLFQRKVPEVITPLCQCGGAAETPAHIALFYTELEKEHQGLREPLAPNHPRLHSSNGGPNEGKESKSTDYYHTGRFLEFRLARKIRQDLGLGGRS
jgi:hypothetical protein